MASASTQIGVLLVNFVAGFFLFVVVMRFMLQAVRADFYNPISQFVVKATNPLLVPLRKVIPGFGGYDIAALVLAYLTQIAAISIITLILGFAQSNII